MLGINGINFYPKIYNVQFMHDCRSVLNNDCLRQSTLRCGAVSNVSFTGHFIDNRLQPLPYIEKHVTKDVVLDALDCNPTISYLLECNGIQPDIDSIKIDNDLIKHLITTYLHAKEIVTQSDLSDESKIILYKAALVHDIGKTLIPEEIVQKPGKLTDSERRIMDLHARLGYEILKTTNVGFDVAEAVRLHHTPVYVKDGNVISQILSVADVFSALKERRAYKPPLSSAHAIEIMGDTPALSQEYVDTLKFIHLC